MTSPPVTWPLAASSRMIAMPVVRLPAAGLADDAEALACVDLEGDAVDRDDARVRIRYVVWSSLTSRRAIRASLQSRGPRQGWHARRRSAPIAGASQRSSWKSSRRRARARRAASRRCRRPRSGTGGSSLLQHVACSRRGGVPRPAERRVADDVHRPAHRDRDHRPVRGELDDLAFDRPADAWSVTRRETTAAC